MGVSNDCSIFSSGELTEDTGCKRGNVEETEGIEEIERQQGYLHRTQTVIADEHVQNEGSCLHPTSCAFSRCFIPEENKWQELEFQDVLRGS